MCVCAYVRQLRLAVVDAARLYSNTCCQQHNHGLALPLSLQHAAWAVSRFPFLSLDCPLVPPPPTPTHGLQEESKLLVANAAKFKNWFNVDVKESTEVVAINREVRWRH
jgi:hypothetical protein